MPIAELSLEEIPYIVDFRFKSKWGLNSLWKAVLQADSAEQRELLRYPGSIEFLDPKRHLNALGRHVGFGKTEFM